MKTLNIKYFGDNDLREFILKNAIAKEKNVLLQVFTGVCDIEFVENLLGTIKELVPHINIIGSTTDGEILQDSVSELSTVLSFSIFEKTTIATYFSEIDGDSYKTAQKLISKFDNNLHPKVAISFVDGLHVNGEEYINAFNDYDKNIIVAGGLAGDNAKFINTIVFTQDGIVHDGAVVALLYNDNLHVNTEASFGWKNIGKTMTITKAIKNIVYEIDNISTTDIYAKYLGDDVALDLPKTGIEFPLIIKRDGLNIPRAVVNKNEDGSLVFAGNLNIGDKVTFGYGNVESILEYGSNICNKKMQGSESIFIYSCMARRALMQESLVAEIRPLSKISSVSGFFTYGEFYSNSDSLSHELLNQTMTILSLSENILEITDSSEAIDMKFKDRRKANSTLKALSHLISQTSSELEEINNSLQAKVNEELQKNRLQDQQLIQQSRLAQIGEMLSMIAHQWRQPLTAISSTSSAINLKAKLNKLDNEKAQELSDKINQYSQYLSKTIDDFRGFFKENKLKESVTLEEVIESSLDIVLVSLENQNIQIVKNLTCKSIFNTYPNELRQVIINLIRNAQDALIENKVVNPTITIKTENGVLSISDNAGGIPTEIVDKIFDPYFSTKLEKDGTGLGLYMSKTIIEDHCGGAIRVENTKDGAMFKIIL